MSISQVFRITWLPGHYYYHCIEYLATCSIDMHITFQTPKSPNIPCICLYILTSYSSLQGHDILMATMLNGAAVMDGAFLLVAANESCPQPQTAEHLVAMEIMELKDIIILQNKVDLVPHHKALNQQEAIKNFVKVCDFGSSLFNCLFPGNQCELCLFLTFLYQGTVAEGAPIIPISAQLMCNIDVLCEYIVKHIPVPERDFVSPPRMILIRSFDVNKPGYEINEIKGGVVGGSILKVCLFTASKKI